jgi:hypothetical protein
MCSPPTPKLSPLQLAILQSFRGSSIGQSNALTNYPSNLPTKPRTNTLGMFGSSPPNLGILSPGALALLGGLPAKARHTFYSFHYADVLRVNQIRKCDQFKTSDRRTPRVIDRSLWETAKKTNPTALASMIDKALAGTSTTCVLAGTETWSREWVKYEIARSLERGNGLLTVYIHNCPCPNNGRSHQGYNPLDQIALGSDMRIYEWEPYVGWKAYSRIPQRLTSWPKWLPNAGIGNLIQLSSGARAYDWLANDGPRNLIHWTDAAALSAGK